jgi:hypothetical protein
MCRWVKLVNWGEGGRGVEFCEAALAVSPSTFGMASVEYKIFDQISLKYLIFIHLPGFCLLLTSTTHTHTHQIRNYICDYI